jgi:hypothetical protein
VGVEDLLYQSPGTREITQGDTIHQWAQVNCLPSKPPTMQWTLNGTTHSRQADHLVWDEEGILPRLCAAQRLMDTTDEERQRAMALQYQLVTKHTNFILVHERADGEKAQDMPRLAQVAQMHAAGVGGYGSAMQDTNSVHYSRAISDSTSTPSLWRTNRTQSVERFSIKAHSAMNVNGLSSSGMEDIEIPAFLRKQTDEDDFATPQKSAPEPVQATFLDSLVNKASALLTTGKPPKQVDNASSNQAVQLKIFLQSLGSPTNPLAEMLHRFNAEALVNNSFRSALSVTLKTTKTNFMTDFIMLHAKALGSPAVVWACLMLWLADSKGLPLERHARRLIDSVMLNLNPVARENLTQQLDSISGAKK